MDPIQLLIDLLRSRLPNGEGLEGQARNFLSKFELVPKHEYQAHLDLLTSLQTQVATLEDRLAQLEKPA